MKSSVLCVVALAAVCCVGCDKFSDSENEGNGLGNAKHPYVAAENRITCITGSYSDGRDWGWGPDTWEFEYDSEGRLSRILEKSAALTWAETLFSRDGSGKLSSAVITVVPYDQVENWDGYYDLGCGDVINVSLTWKEKCAEVKADYPKYPLKDYEYVLSFDGDDNLCSMACGGGGSTGSFVWKNGDRVSFTTTTYTGDRIDVNYTYSDKENNFCGVCLNSFIEPRDFPIESAIMLNDEISGLQTKHLLSSVTTGEEHYDISYTFNASGNVETMTRTKKGNEQEKIVWHIYYGGDTPSADEPVVNNPDGLARVASIKLGVDYWTEEFKYNSFAENEYELQFNYGIDKRLAELRTFVDGKYDGSKSFKFEWFEGKIRISRIGYPECYYDVSLNDKGYVRASERTGYSKVSYAFEYNDAGFLSSVERTIGSTTQIWSYEWSDKGILAESGTDWGKPYRDEYDISFDSGKNNMNVDLTPLLFLEYADADDYVNLLMFLRLAGRGNEWLLRSVDTSDWKLAWSVTLPDATTTPGVTIHETETYYRYGVWTGKLDYEFVKDGVVKSVTTTQPVRKIQHDYDLVASTEFAYERDGQKYYEVTIKNEKETILDEGVNTLTWTFEYM